jgi:hypothetical protein
MRNDRDNLKGKMEGEWFTVTKHGKKKAVPPPPELPLVNYDKYGCDICDEQKKTDNVLKSMVNQLASKDAHMYAMSEASKEDTEKMPWVDWYLYYFRVIYEYERKRHYTYQSELLLDRILLQYEKSNRICSYHSENIGWLHDGHHEKCQKEVTEQFHAYPWPNRKMFEGRWLNG